MIKEKYHILNDKTVLYVEDDIALQSNIKEILNHFFKKIYLASDGDEAYTLYIENQNKIDILITDINMPYTNGITLSKHIREYNKHLPIVVVSAYTNTDYLLDSIDLNILKYITKPLTTQKIILLLDKFLDYFQLNNSLSLNNNIQFNHANGLLLINKQKVKLTKKESKFFKLLFENDIVTYDMMYEYLWDYDRTPSADAIKSFIQKFKKKLPKNLCKNQQSIGYFLDKKTLF